MSSVTKCDVSRNGLFSFLRKECDSNVAAILLKKPKMNGGMSMNEKLIINTNLLRKESEFRTKSCVVEKAIAVSHAEFDLLSGSMNRSDLKSTYQE